MSFTSSYILSGVNYTEFTVGQININYLQKTAQAIVCYYFDSTQLANNNVSGQTFVDISAMPSIFTGSISQSTIEAYLQTLPQYGV